MLGTHTNTQGHASTTHRVMLQHPHTGKVADLGQRPLAVCPRAPGQGRRRPARLGKERSEHGVWLWLFHCCVQGQLKDNHLHPLFSPACSMAGMHATPAQRCFAAASGSMHHLAPTPAQRALLGHRIAALDRIRVGVVDRNLQRTVEGSKAVGAVRLSRPDIGMAWHGWHGMAWHCNSWRGRGMTWQSIP